MAVSESAGNILQPHILSTSPEVIQRLSRRENHVIAFFPRGILFTEGEEAVGDVAGGGVEVAVDREAFVVEAGLFRTRLGEPGGPRAAGDEIVGLALDRKSVG